MKFGLDELARIVSGELIQRTGQTPLVKPSQISIDSRDTGPGSVFVALKGAMFDGHQFVGQAFEHGAIAAIVERELPVPGSLIVVRDSLAALTSVARRLRDVVDPLTVGITGSVGKTTTKDFLAAIAARKFATVANERSMNAETGVPLTLLRLTMRSELLICELAARGAGQIAELCSYVRPQVGVVTNVDVAHLEKFGSRQAIAEAKAELVHALPEGGTAILNADDPAVVAMGVETKAEVLTFGTSGPAWLRGERISFDNRARARFRMVQGVKAAQVELQLPGRHQVDNALAASAAGLAIGMSMDECRTGLEEAIASPWRMEMHEVGGVVFINDAWNAGPRSVASALETAAGIAGEDNRLVVVLGHMAELGQVESEEHRRVGALAASLATRLITVGAVAEQIAEGARAAGLEDVREVAEPGDALYHLDDLRPGDVVVVKASRVVGLEGLIPAAIAATKGQAV